MLGLVGVGVLLALVSALAGYRVGQIQREARDLGVRALETRNTQLEGKLQMWQGAYQDVAALYRAAVSTLPPPAPRPVLLREVIGRVAEPDGWEIPIIRQSLPRQRAETTRYCSRPTLDLDGMPLFPEGDA